jgi:hypothetical protein
LGLRRLRWSGGLHDAEAEGVGAHVDGSETSHEEKLAGTVPHRLAFGAVFGRSVWLSLAAVAALAAVACGGAPPNAPTILRPIDEPHAVAIMARVFRQLGLEPVRHRVIKFGASGTDLVLDIAAKERRFGIAYITWQDADKLGDELPKRRDPDAIIVVHGSGEDDDAHVALLFAADYMQDDLSGEQHTATAIAAQNKLELATRDILRRAEHENWQ